MPSLEPHPTDLVPATPSLPDLQCLPALPSSMVLTGTEPPLGDALLDPPLDVQAELEQPRISGPVSTTAAAPTEALTDPPTLAMCAPVSVAVVVPASMVATPVASHPRPPRTATYSRLG